METEGKGKAGKGKCNYFLLDVSDRTAVLGVTHADPLSPKQYCLFNTTLLARKRDPACKKQPMPFYWDLLFSTENHHVKSLFAKKIC